MTEQTASPIQEVAVAAAPQVQKSGEELLNQVLANAVDKAVAGAGEAMDWAVEQAGELIQQLLMWNFVQATVIAVLWTIILVVLTIIYRKIWTSSVEWRDSESRFLARMFGGIGLGAAYAIILSIAVIPNTMEAIKIHVAPKLWLLEYAIQLTRGITH